MRIQTLTNKAAVSQLSRDSICSGHRFGYLLYVSIVVIIFTIASAIFKTAIAAEPNTLRFGIDAGDLGTGDPHRAASRNGIALQQAVGLQPEFDGELARRRTARHQVARRAA